MRPLLVDRRRDQELGLNPPTSFHHLRRDQDLVVPKQPVDSSRNRAWSDFGTGLQASRIRRTASLFAAVSSDIVASIFDTEISILRQLSQMRQLMSL